MTIKRFAALAAAITALAATSAAQAAPASSQAASVAHEATPAQHIQLARAGIATPGIRNRIQRQNRRIRRGIETGRLTWRETRIVRSGLHRVRRALRRARADGFVTRGERIRIHRMLDRNSSRIARLANNRRGGGRHL